MRSRSKKIVFVCAGIFLIAGAGFLIKNHFYKSSSVAAESSSAYKTNVKTYSDFKGINLKKENITVSFEGNSLNLTLPVYVDNNRYYLPLTEIINNINGKITIKEGIADVEVNNYKISLNTSENYFTLNGEKFNLKKKVVVSDDIVYVSLFDLKKMLNLKIDWDEANNNIGLFWNKDTIAADKQPESGKTALLRFEDVTADQRYATSESLEKLRTIFDYCYSKNIPMHLGWVPRYIDAKNNIDNDPAGKYSIHNANFVYTLDYFVDKYGIIGLHGYTHQYGNQVSIDGIEFNGKYNSSEKSVRERLGYAINDAKKLEIPISFFESPHYAATPSQKKIIEQYFDNIYEYRVSQSEKNITKVNSGDRVVKFIPTPLNYVDGKEDTDNMIAKIKALGKDELGSFFYHPSIEFEFITIKKDINGYPTYEYSSESPLHRIVNTFIDHGYKFKDINTL
jgi:hypothetical protein